MITLWGLSSFSSATPEQTQQIPHFDKFAHFTYFFAGGIILGTWWLLKRGNQSPALFLHLVPIIFLGVFGMIDEYRQSFIPGRSGNDIYDWMADFLGSCVGVFLANRFHSCLFKFSSPSPSMTESEN
jgi:VanZ family protein